MIKLFFILAVTRCDRLTRRLYSHVLNVYSTISKRTWLGECITRSKYLKNGYKYFSLYNYQGNSVRAFLHEGGEPQIGEVTPLGGVKKNNPPLHAILQPRHPGVHFLKITEWSLST